MLQSPGPISLLGYEFVTLPRVVVCHRRCALTARVLVGLGGSGPKCWLSSLPSNLPKFGPQVSVVEHPGGKSSDIGIVTATACIVTVILSSIVKNKV